MRAPDVLGDRARLVSGGGKCDNVLVGQPIRRARGALTAAEVEASDAAYAAAMRRVAPALEAYLGVALPGVVDRAGAVDRAGWARANVRVLARLFARVEGDYPGVIEVVENDRPVIMNHCLHVERLSLPEGRGGAVPAAGEEIQDQAEAHEQAENVVAPGH